jgi:LuxR family maltose regulon positive regulatory protein
LLGYVLLAKAALALGDPSGARTLAREAERARRRDASPIDLVRQLGEVHEQLSVPMASTSVAITPLTAAELRVLPFLATHLTLQEVADRLIISRNTAKSHAVAIYRKLGVSSRSAAVSEARRLGLIVDPAAD